MSAVCFLHECEDGTPSNPKKKKSGTTDVILQKMIQKAQDLDTINKFEIFENCTINCNEANGADVNVNSKKILLFPQDDKLRIRHGTMFKLDKMNHESFKAFVVGGNLLHIQNTDIKTPTSKLIESGIGTSLINQELAKTDKDQQNMMQKYQI